jgi:hypothetical protein
MRNTERGAIHNSILRTVAGLGTLAMLASPAFAERKDVIDCRTGAYEKTVTLDIRDGDRETISTQPDRLSLTSRERGGVLVEWRNLTYDTPTPLYVGREDQMNRSGVGINVPDTAILRSDNKVHEISFKGRNANDTGSVVKVKGVCPENAPSK